MPNTEKLITFERYEEHKGFYNYSDGEKALCNVMYSDFFEYPEDDFRILQHTNYCVVPVTILPCR